MSTAILDSNFTQKHIKQIIESFFFAASDPLSVDQLQKLLQPEILLSKQEIVAILAEIAHDHANNSIELKEVANGFRFQVKTEFANWINRLWAEKPPKYSRAILETLAIIVYKQPITRAEIENIRGVAINNNVLKTLIEREWIKIAGYRDTPGKPSIYTTTEKFLDYFNLKNLSELPVLDSEALQLELELE